MGEEDPSRRRGNNEQQGVIMSNKTKIRYESYEETHPEWIVIKAEKKSNKSNNFVILCKAVIMIGLLIGFIGFIGLVTPMPTATPSDTPTETLALIATTTPIHPRLNEIDQILATLDSGEYVRAGTKATKIPKTPATMLRNPTFDEMMAFLNKSTVNWNTYVSSQRGRYVCVDFACDLQDEAAGLGIRSAIVIVIFPKGSDSHALVAFETTDKGLIYWEPQVDHRMEVEIGRKYWSWIYWPDYDYQIDYDDTVVSIRHFWDTKSLERRYLCP